MKVEIMENINLENQLWRILDQAYKQRWGASKIISTIKQLLRKPTDSEKGIGGFTQVSTVKILNEDQPCRRCGTPVVKKQHSSKWQPKPKQPYYYTYWFKCPKCKNLYMVESAKIYLQEDYAHQFASKKSPT